MNGVEILSSKEIYNTILPSWVAFIAFVAAFMCLVVLIYGLTEAKLLPSIFGGVLFLICMTIFVLSLYSNKNSINHIEYKVTIDDSVSMNEFLDKYEILDQEGKIYTVKERE
jgi:archaellum biogenesis protein FlaJ (TadC family)